MKVPAKWHLIPSNSISTVRECDRHAHRQSLTDGQFAVR